MVTFLATAMASELQELKDLVLRLQAEKEQLLQERAVASASQLGSGPGSPAGSQRSLPNDPSPIERVLYIPRERKCPFFRGTSGIPVEDWVEEMRATLRIRHMKSVEQAYFIYDHLEGEAKDEIRYRPRAEREDPEKILTILLDLYGCSESYVSLQQCFFSQKQQEGESLQEFSHALYCLMEKVERCAPSGLPGAPTLLRDQFVEHVHDANLRRELKQMVRQHPGYTLLDIRAEAIRWEREGRPDESRARSYSVPSFSAMQCSEARAATCSSNTEMTELKHMLQKQQEQLNQLTEGLLALQAVSRPHTKPPPRPPRPNTVICRRCQRPGHYANECNNERVDSRFQRPQPSHPIAAISAAQDAGNFPPLM